MASTVLHLFKYLAGLEPAATQTSVAERALLARYAAKSSRLLEIGVFEGRTTAEIARAMPSSAKIYGVDPFFTGRLGICWTRIIARREVRKHAAQVQFVEMLSGDAARAIDGDFDFIFFDGDHSLEGITTDWASWASRCRPGGIMAFHDVLVSDRSPHVAGFGSHHFFNDVILKSPDFEMIDSVDSLAVIRRR